MLQQLRGEKFQRANRWAKRHPKKHRQLHGINRHHMIPRSRNGKSDESNLLKIKMDRHTALHRVFHNMTWQEIGDALQSVFGLRNPQKCLEVVDRVARLKASV